MKRLVFLMFGFIVVAGVAAAGEAGYSDAYIQSGFDYRVGPQKEELACPNAYAAITITPTSLNFNGVPIGNSATKIFSIRNQDTFYNLELINVRSLSPDYVIVKGPATPLCMPKKSTRNVTVAFLPTRTGRINSRIEIQHRDGFGFYLNYVDVTGVGQAASDLQVSPTSLDFGSIPVGGSSEKSFTIQNRGGASGDVTQIRSSDSVFRILSPTFPKTIAAGQSLSVRAAFLPTAAGAKRGSFTVIGPSSTVLGTVALAGTGLAGNPDIGVSPRNLDFGPLDVGTFKDLALVISNTGQGPLQIQDFSSTNPTVKTMPAAPLEIAAGRTAQVKVRYRSLAVGPRTDTLMIRSNDPDESAVPVALTSTGAKGILGFIDRSTRSRVGNNTVQTNGVQWVDFNNDGRLDLFLPGNGGNAMFRNSGNGQFVNATKATRLGMTGSDSSGGSWADVDNDGDPDLFLSDPNGPGMVLKNNRGVFIPMNAALGVFPAENGSGSNGGIWLDYNNDGRIDLFVIRDGQPNQLFKNLGTFRFSDIAQSAGLAYNGPGRSAVAADFNNDGYQDLYVVNFNRPNKLYLNLKNDKFRDISGSAGVGFSGPSRQAVVADYDSDGDIDLFVTGNSGPPRLYRNLGNLKFQNATAAAGLASSRPVSAAFSDFDADGDEDLIVVQKSGNIVYRNTGAGKFVRVNNVDVSDPDDPTGTGTGDYNNDGLPDIGVGDGDNSQENGDSVYENSGGAGNNWLVLTLRGTRSNRAAIGAKVVVRAGLIFQAKLVTSGNGQNQDSLPLEFGLGQATSAASIIIEWPSGTVQTLQNVAGNQRLTITESAQP